MRIVFLVPDVHGRSGWSRYVSDLGQELHARGHEIIALVHSKTDVAWAREYACLPKSMHALTPFVCFMYGFRTFVRLLWLRPDVVHVIAEPYGMVLAAAPMGPWRLCMTLHGTYVVSPLRRGWCSRWLLERFYKHAHVLLAVSQFTRDYLLSQEVELGLYLKEKGSLHVLGNAIDVRRFNSTFVPRTQANIITVGAVKKRKGYKQAIEACAVLAARGMTSFTYNIVGDVEQDVGYVSELYDLIRKHHLEKMVFLHGNVSDEALGDFYRNSSVFLLLSIQTLHDFEGFGLVFLEAAANGLPCIGPNTGGCPEAIASGASGYICNPDKAEEVADRLEDILVHKSITSLQCRTWAEQHAIQAFVDTLLLHYQEGM